MPRKKPSNIEAIKDLAQANQALEKIARLKRKVAQIETNMNEQIDQAKAAGAEAAAPFKAQMAAIEAGLIAFAEFNKLDLFRVKRTRELDHGRMGYRKSTELKPKAKITWAMVLQRLKELAFGDAIRTAESVDKEALHGWPDERLDMVGVRRVAKDQFWYETDEEKIADTAS